MPRMNQKIILSILNTQCRYFVLASSKTQNNFSAHVATIDCGIVLVHMFAETQQKHTKSHTYLVTRFMKEYVGIPYYTNFMIR